MATGKQHKNATINFAPFSFVLSAAVSQEIVASLFVFLGCMAGVLLSPDLDIKRITESEKVLIRFNKAIGYMFVGIFYPYAMFIPHRSPLSHMPIVSTLIRCIYLVTVMLLLSAPAWYVDIINYEVLIEYLKNKTTIHYLVSFFCGLCYSDTVHWIMDGCPTPNNRVPFRK